MGKIMTFDNILNILLSIPASYGFVKIFTTILEKNLADIFIIITLPLIIGSLLINNKEFKVDGLIFLISFLLLIGWLLLTLASTSNLTIYLSTTLLWPGAIIFSFGILNLWMKAAEELKKELFNKS